MKNLAFLHNKEFNPTERIRRTIPRKIIKIQLLSTSNLTAKVESTTDTPPEFKDEDLGYMNDGPVWSLQKAFEIAAEMREGGNNKDDGIMRVTVPERHNSITFENNIFYIEGTYIYGSFFDTMADGNLISNKNLYFDETGEYKTHENKKFDIFEKVKAFGYDADSIIADPQFKDIKNFDFTLADDSPTYGIEFKPIDINDVGPRK